MASLKSAMIKGCREPPYPSILTDATMEKLALAKFVAQESKCEVSDWEGNSRGMLTLACLGLRLSNTHGALSLARSPRGEGFPPGPSSCPLGYVLRLLCYHCPWGWVMGKLRLCQGLICPVCC